MSLASEFGSCIGISRSLGRGCSMAFGYNQKHSEAQNVRLADTLFPSVFLDLDKNRSKRRVRRPDCIGDADRQASPSICNGDFEMLSLHADGLGRNR